MNEMIKIDVFNDRPVVSSRQIADDFSKSHQHVLRDIDGLKDVSNFGLMFFETTLPDSYGRPQRAYLIDRDGFSLLVMGFTGKDALDWKIKYIQAFNAMEKGLTIASPSCIEDVLITALQEMKAARKEITRLNGRVDNAAKVVQDIRSHVHYDPHTWREDTNAKIADIAQATGREFRFVRGEIYKELEIRGHCNLENRLKNRQQRAIEAGTSKTEAGKINKLDTIADDGRLREIFCAIVTQWAVQHGIAGVRV